MSEPAKPPVEMPEEWFRYAQGDLTVAERELSSDAPALHTICFLCQGAAEKYIKGLLIARGWELVKTHDITRLMDMSQTYGLDFGELRADGDLLNEYITAGRYPGDLVSSGALTRTEAKEAIAAAHRIRDRVLELMRK